MQSFQSQKCHGLNPVGDRLSVFVGPDELSDQLKAQIISLPPYSPLKPVISGMMEGQQMSAIAPTESKNSAVIFNQDGVLFLVGEADERLRILVTQRNFYSEFFSGRGRSLLVPLSDSWLRSIREDRGALEEISRISFKGPLGPQPRVELDRDKTFIPISDELLKENHDFEILSQQKRSWQDLRTAHITGETWCIVLTDSTMKVVATAGAFAIGGGEAELNVATRPEFRQSGYGFAVCSFVIQRLCERGYQPIWSCNEKNVRSQRLALSLGFVPTGRSVVFSMTY
jgi:RimJ/RimL family protein N-acetyltransferase